jgi:hypothetical protein
MLNTHEILETIRMIDVQHRLELPISRALLHAPTNL